MRGNEGGEEFTGRSPAGNPKRGGRSRLKVSAERAALLTGLEVLARS